MTKAYIENKEVLFQHLGEPVLYLPEGITDPNHPDCELGFISKVNKDKIWIRLHYEQEGKLCNSNNLKWYFK